MLERLLFATSPAVENIDSTGTEAADAYRVIAYSANRTFSADFRRTKIRRRIRLTAPARGSTKTYKIQSLYTAKLLITSLVFVTCC